ncbi:MAG: glycosyltransferase family 39 protein [Nitrospirota bacterium]
MSIFGKGIAGIHLGLTVVNLAALPALFMLTKRLISERAATLASASCAVISVSVPVFGLMAHATHFVVFFAVWGVYFLYVAIEDNKTWLLAASGLCLGMAFMMKQHGILFIFFALTYLYITRVSIKNYVINALILTLTSALPFAVTLFIIYRGGMLGNFWFWCFTYSGKYVSSLSLMDGLKRFMTMAPRMVKHFTALWIFGVAGFCILIKSQIKTAALHKLFILLFFLFSFMSILPGLYFREHYFVLIIPAISITAVYFIELLNGTLSEKFQNKIIHTLPIALLLSSLIYTLTVQSEIYFKLSPMDVSRKIYGLNPFIESVKIAEFLKSRTKGGDRIAILGSEPQILFYSGIRSATGYIYMYGLMEDQPYNLQMQKAMTSEIEQAMPAFIIFVNIPASWLPSKNAPLYIFDWARTYIETNYVLTGVVDFIYYDDIVYKFDAEALNYSPRSKIYICIYKLKDGGGHG